MKSPLPPSSPSISETQWVNLSLLQGGFHSALAMGKKRNNEKQKVILPPELPTEVTEEEIEVSDEDLEFFKENQDYAVSFIRLDTKSISNMHLKMVGTKRQWKRAA
ncbi:uncharacterized protein LOC111468445 [Cucurbita maxima]|uniref:Uncharacterized protein LOC111468445 n=1 Tax=Cucurbita maxima TaxID=3661 RepID=A0A6J1HXT9_CUCMA|nr:uncharacterized protein LOC111468445 [Cucurbita maxima]